MGSKWIKIAVIYFLVGISVGLFMSSSLQLQWASAHAHVNLVGWVSTAIMGVIYSVYPKAGNNVLGKWHFWLYNIGLPIFLLSTFMVQVKGMLDFAHIFTFTGGGLLAVGLIVFVVNIYINVHDNDTINPGKKAS
ncbi:MAG TPA: cbb3-type cytochrome c oxidase subunit I [Candidatus Avamphibacillus sp.]|nr:cbb3-type cytochrome c oxidase subunit I [Candidatus Avamphibacillus sp.]